MFLWEPRILMPYFAHVFIGSSMLPNLILQTYRGEGVEESNKVQLRVVGRYFIDLPQLEGFERIAPIGDAVRFAPRDVWARIFSKFRKLPGNDDAIWGLIFASITLADLLSMSKRSNSKEGSAWNDLRELPNFRSLLSMLYAMKAGCETLGLPEGLARPNNYVIETGFW